ncbi:hypothetical protein [Brevibacillus choshinensis]|uniref:Uncharacterized protein n=1 Tax=Brevibacillus choshinensis TaxID=54911 RepID=A0ABX7FI80_BRECH|nr:hypothetical protein [Brevibacillus choshinensis]QRG65928.1 hypothetical protein JNE38_20435 [Brevibacillus choshinensis]
MNVYLFEKWNLTNIPWQRLTTPYGRGSDLPEFIANGNYDEIANLVEHQGTLWQVTPWVLSLLLRELKAKRLEDVSPAELRVYEAIADSLTGRELESIPHVTHPELLLEENYLWPIDEEEDELIWEEEEPPGYAQLPFSSYYYSSGLLLLEAIPDFERLRDGNADLATQVSELLKKLDPIGSPSNK